MKKFMAIVAILFTFLACADVKNEPTEPASADAQRPLVYTSNYPLRYFVERIAGSLVDVHVPVAGDEDPAYWKPAPDDVLAMQKADVIVLNGASYEAWLKNVSLPPARLLITSEGLRDRLIPLAEATTHSHGLEGDHEHSGTAFTTWLDPTLASAQAEAIKDAFAARWPQHTGLFEAQLTALTEDLAALDAGLQEAVQGQPELPVLFSHPVYQYLTQRYQLNARSVHWEPDQAPDETQWQEFVALLEEFPAEWMIWEDTPQPQIVERLESIGIRSVVFDPCANAPESGDYLSVMRENVKALRLVYGPAGGCRGSSLQARSSIARGGSRRMTRVRSALLSPVRTG
jgi:zinc transport system substrate-binding protein